MPKVTSAKHPGHIRLMTRSRKAARSIKRGETIKIDYSDNPKRLDWEYRNLHRGRRMNELPEDLEIMKRGHLLFLSLPARKKLTVVEKTSL